MAIYRFVLPIFNNALETFIWSIMWKISQFFQYFLCNIKLPNDVTNILFYIINCGSIFYPFPPKFIAFLMKKMNSRTIYMYFQDGYVLLLYIWSDQDAKIMLQLLILFLLPQLKYLVQQGLDKKIKICHVLLTCNKYIHATYDKVCKNLWYVKL